MAIDTSTSQVSTNALQALPFGSIIGGPLNACIEAQAMAARATWEFIQDVCLSTNPETGEKSAVNISFSFIQNGRLVQLNVPLMTIIPVPYMAIHTVEINFKANIVSSSSIFCETTESTTIGADAGINAGVKVGLFNAEAKINANYSSKKDSKATAESKYSVEYTIDVAIKAGQDCMPAGLAKVLELLGNSLSVSDPKGALEVNSTQLALKDGKTKLVTTYKDSNGLYDPEKLSIEGVNYDDFIISGDNRVIELDTVGMYTVKAGERSVIVEVIDTFVVTPAE